MPTPSPTRRTRQDLLAQAAGIRAGLPHDPADPAWAEPFPDWMTAFRAPQLEAVGEVLRQFDAGKKVVFLNAPTGTGKTLIAEMVRRALYMRGIGHDKSALYICTTKALQDQFLEDYDHAAVLKGRANYPVGGDEWGQQGFDVGDAPGVAKPDRRIDITAADCTASGPRTDCRWCGPRERCPYQIARHAATANELAVLNTAYTLADLASANPTFTGGADRRSLAVFDEADLLESELMSSVSVSITERRAKQLGLDYPDRKTVEEAWVSWATYAVDAVKAHLDKLGPIATADVTTVKEIRSTKRLHSQLVLVAGEIGDGGWVYNYDDRGTIEFKPVRIDKWGPRVAQAGDHVLVMSATIISAEQMARDLGFDRDETRIDWGVVDVPMGFPVEHRPIYVTPVAPMTNKTMRESLPKMLDAVIAVVQRHPDERILVHAVSYKLARDITHALNDALRGRKVVSYQQSRDKDAALTEFTDEFNYDAVMVAASMDRGIDLPGDLCRVQIIAKVPYPYLGDKQVAARLRSPGGQSWFSMLTVRTLVQMTGRAVRSRDDWAVTYILDAQFSSIFNKSRKLLPKWWQEGIDWRGSPKPAELTGRGKR